VVLRSRTAHTSGTRTTHLCHLQCYLQCHFSDVTHRIPYGTHSMVNHLIIVWASFGSAPQIA